MSRLIAAAALMAFAGTAMVGTDTIRVAIVENARLAELRGVDIEVSELGCPACPGRSWRTDAVRALRPSSSKAVRGCAGFGSMVESGI